MLHFVQTYTFLPIDKKTKKIKFFVVSKNDVDMWHSKLGYPHSKVFNASAQIHLF